jgi:hypothetical protein
METTAPKRGVRLFTVVLLIGLALAVVIVGLQLANQNRTQPRSGPAPQFSVITYDAARAGGRPQFLGKLVRAVPR